MMADLHLPLKPRSDLALAQRHRPYSDPLRPDRPRRTSTRTPRASRNWRGFVEAYTPERVAEITGLSEELIYKTALLYGRAQAGFIGWTMGVNHSTLGTATVNAICNLALLTGNIGRAGASPFSITGQCNAMGTREAGFTSSLPGYRKFDNAADRAELAAIWGMSTKRGCQRSAGLAYPDIIEAAVAKKIRALWIIATNPLVSFPNQDVLRQALSNLDFLVVQDGYHPTPTTELADLVLPAAIWGEKEGTYTNSERRVSKVNKAVEPPGEARSDFDIFLARRGKARLPRRAVSRLAAPSKTLSTNGGAFRAGRLCDYSGISYELLAERMARCSGRLPEGAAPYCDASLRRRQFPDARRPRQAVCTRLGAVSGAAQRATIRSFSTPDAPWSTGIRAPKRARCRFWSIFRRAPGWR